MNKAKRPTTSVVPELKDPKEMKNSPANAATQARAAAELARKKSVEANKASAKAAEELIAAQKNAATKAQEAEQAQKEAAEAASAAVVALTEHLKPEAIEPPAPPAPG